MQHRIEYIDYIKGFAIIWIAWFHTYHPNFGIDTIPIMALFFFVSGIFFKMEPLRIFIQKKIQTLLIPYIFFYVLSSLLYIGVKHIQPEYITPGNVPLWFLPTLIAMQATFYIILKLKTNTLLCSILCLLSFCVACFLREEHMSFKIVFYRMFYYFPFFVLGYFSKNIVRNNVKLIKDKYRTRISLYYS